MAVFLFGVGLVQLYSLWSVMRAGAKLSFAYHLVPLSGIAAAVFVFLYRHFTPEDPLAFQVLGAALIVYAAFEVVLAVQLRKVTKTQPIPTGKEKEAGKPAASVVTLVKPQEETVSPAKAGTAEEKTEEKPEGRGMPRRQVRRSPRGRRRRKNRRPEPFTNFWK